MIQEVTFEKILENAKLFLNNIPHTNLMLLTHMDVENSRVILDAVILVNQKQLAGIEFKENVSSLNQKQLYSEIKTSNYNLKYIIYTDSLTFKVVNTHSLQITIFKNIEAALGSILTQATSAEVDKIKSKIDKEIREEILAFEKELKEIIDETELKHLQKRVENIQQAMFLLRNGKNVIKNLIYDNDSQSYHMVADIRDFSEFEHSIFKTLIEGLSPEAQIFRYTSLDSAFKTLDSGTIRLSGIVGMNDVSETNYVDSYLDKKKEPFPIENISSDINRTFIMCCSELEDDLVQWRLYGDDCKGACLMFRLTEPNDLPGLLLKRVNYGIKLNGSNFHPELEIFRRIQDRVKNNVNVDLKFRTFQIWKHFFKPFEYKSEKEVRLLLIGNQIDEVKGTAFLSGFGESVNVKWNLTYSHNILTPYVSLQLNNPVLRFDLRQIMLGSKCPEINVNLNQFRHFTRKKGLNIDVQPSTIRNYR